MNYFLSEIAAICGGSLTGADVAVTGAFTDSRNSAVGAGSLFVTIGGRNHDGHTYINELYVRGVRGFIVERDVMTDKYADAGFVTVESSVGALQKLAAHHRAGFRGTVVGITGSNGKTVVKEWIAGLVPPEVKIFRSPKSYNSQIGVPLSVLMIKGDEEIAVIEAGISEPGEMERLERIIRSDVGIITTLGDAHQENFGSLEEKAAEKLKLFRSARTIIYNSAYSLISAELRAEYPSARLVDAAAQKEAYAVFGDKASRENAAAALTLCDVLGFDHDASAARLAELHPVAMRLELKEGINDSLIVNDSYNSDINSLAIALDYLKSVAGNRRRTLILSDILQSGFPEPELYACVASLVKGSGVERLVGVGEKIKRYGALFSGLDAEFCPTTESYLASMRREDVAGRAILLKGNRASQFERLSHALERLSHTTVMEIDLDAMIHNLNLYRARLVPGTKLMAMVKASGYGNGDYEVAGMLQHEGVDYLAVAFADEGVLLRRRGITVPIVVLNADSDSFELMIANWLEPEIYSMNSLAAFAAALRRYGERAYPVHIKLDTGMHRLGFGREDIEQLCAALKADGGMICVSTIFSHLACSDDPAEDSFTRRQIALFEDMSARIMSVLPYRPLRHIANSAAIGRLPEARFDMVRLGIGLYGVGEAGLRPVSVLRSRIVQIKRLAAGETVGYGREGKIEKPAVTATVPVGYADGLNRRLGNGRWSFKVNGKPAPTLGRISMDTCVIDIAGIDAAEGDEVIIFGSGKGNGLEDMAHALGTIPYEVMTGIARRVKRVYIKE